MGYIGCHLSVSNGYKAMGNTMLSLGGNTFAFFTRNPRGGRTKEIIPEDARDLNELAKREGFGPFVAHGSYTMNLCSAKPETRKNGLDMFQKDIRRMEFFPEQLYNFHPGSHIGQGIETGISLIADGLNQVLNPNITTMVLLETMAGKGSEIGGRFEELREIIDRTECKEKIGVCFDTCHVWDAGYDLVSNLDGVLTRFDQVIGLEQLLAVHLNEKLGHGQIGEEALKRIVQHPVLAKLPFILETPNDDEGYRKEIQLVRQWMENEQE